MSTILLEPHLSGSSDGVLFYVKQQELHDNREIKNEYAA